MSLDIMGIISQAFGMMKARLAALSGIWLLFFVILIAVSFLFFGGIVAQFANLAVMEDPTALGAGLIGSMILFYIFYLLLNFAQSVSLTHQASPVHHPAFAESLTAGFRSIPTLLGLTVLLIVAYIVLLIPISLLGVIFSLLGDAGSILFALVVLGLMLWVACRLVLMMPVIAVDGELNPIKVITRSWKLTSGHVLAIFVAILVFTIIIVVTALILMTIFGGAFAAMVDPTASATGLGVFSILALLVFAAFWAAMVIFSSAFIASLHNALAGPRATAETFA